MIEKHQKIGILSTIISFIGIIIFFLIPHISTLLIPQLISVILGILGWKSKFGKLGIFVSIFFICLMFGYFSFGQPIVTIIE